MSYQPHLHKKIYHAARHFIAGLWLSKQNVIQIAITGSQGKTNTTKLIYEMLNKYAPTVVTDINLDTIYNVPITALHVSPKTKYALFELGIDHPGEMDSYLKIVKPNIAIITGISPVHADSSHLGSLENIIYEKRKLIESLAPSGYAILNHDDEHVRKMSLHTKGRIIFYGTRKEADIWVENVSVSLQGTHFTLHDKTKTYELSTKLIGKHHIYTIMAAYAVQKILNLPENTFIEAVSASKPLHRRLSVEKGPMDTILLDDSLRANPASTASGITTLSEIIYVGGRKIAVLGEMGELGDYAVGEHKKIGTLLSSQPIDWFIGIGPLQKYTIEEAIASGLSPNRALWAENVFVAAELLKKILKKGDMLYLKGSVLRHVERVILLLEKNEVACTVINCPFYNHCSKCSYLKSGYQNLIDF